MTALPGMTWRRYLILLNGLSPNSATATALQIRSLQRGAAPKVKMLRSPEAVQRFIESQYGITRKHPVEAN